MAKLRKAKERQIEARRLGEAYMASVEGDQRFYWETHPAKQVGLSNEWVVGITWRSKANGEKSGVTLPRVELDSQRVFEI